MSERALFEPDGGEWVPDPRAQGPFTGLQGGGVAALMASQVEAKAMDEGWGSPCAVTTHFLRPTPMKRLKTSLTPMRVGRRVSIVDATTSCDGDIVAIQRVTLLSTLIIDAPPDGLLAATSGFETWPRKDHDIIRKPEWLWTAMDARQAPDARVWFRLPCPITPLSARVSACLPAADWAHGIRPPRGAVVRPPVMIPNVDLTVHVHRIPEGDWIGLDPTLAMSRNGLAAGWSPLFDVQGQFGRVAMSVATLPI